MLRQLTSVSLVVLLLASPAFADIAAPKRPLDESALRYYASLGQKNRVAAESRRLSKLDTSWHVPDDLYSAHPGRPDEGPLWALYGQNRVDDLTKAIAMRQADEPGWMPSDDLATKIKTKALRAHVMQMAKAEDWHAIVESFKGSGIAWAKDDAEALWVVAEAYARENDCGEAYIVYRSILADHTDVNERRATIEHAIALIPMSYAEKLIAMARTDASGRGEFAPIAIDITRARMSAFLHDEPANEVGDDELKAFQAFVQDAKDPNEPGLVAWYAFKRRDYAQALDWFKLAIGHGGDAMIAHGLAHTLRMLGMKREAEEVAFAWREPLVNNSILFIDLLETDLTKEQPPYIEPARIARYAQVSMATESGEGAQALGWYAYNTCQYPLALQWFERAVAWLPKEATAYGYALALQRMRRSKDFHDVVNRYDGLFPKVVALAFDDGIRKPPPPCEADTRNPSAPPRPAPVLEGRPGPDWTGRTMADTLKPQTIALHERPAETPGSIRARVPSPEALANGTDGTLPPLTKKTEFPSAVSPENPLRFSVLRTVATEDQRVRPRDAAWPLVARRVPGVGAMPYERYGFTLMPGWDGTTDASSPTSADRAPPQGTLWALEQSLHDDATVPSTRQSSDPLSRQPLAKASIESPSRSDRRS
jgi:tetratricopeptide (TPR) repeat protein